MVQETVDSRMGIIFRPEDGGCLDGFVGSPDILNLHGRDNHPLWLPQRNSLALAERCREIWRYIECDRDRPDKARRQAHILDNALILLPSDKSLKGGKSTIPNQLQGT